MCKDMVIGQQLRELGSIWLELRWGWWGMGMTDEGKRFFAGQRHGNECPKIDSADGQVIIHITKGIPLISFKYGALIYQCHFKGLFTSPEGL